MGPLPNGCFMAYKWGVIFSLLRILTGMALQVVFFFKHMLVSMKFGSTELKETVFFAFCFFPKLPRSSAFGS